MAKLIYLVWWNLQTYYIWFDRISTWRGDAHTLYICGRVMIVHMDCYTVISTWWFVTFKKLYFFCSNDGAFEDTFDKVSQLVFMLLLPAELDFLRVIMHPFILQNTFSTSVLK